MAGRGGLAVVCCDGGAPIAVWRSEVGAVVCSPGGATASRSSTIEQRSKVGVEVS
jgi:hypothetical protein